VGKKYNGPTIKEGYRFLLIGETVRKGDLVGFLDNPGYGWLGTKCAGTMYSTIDKGCGLIYCRKIAAPKTRKAPAIPKPSEVVWTKKFLSIHPKATKADLTKLLHEAMGQLNDIGIKWAKAQNTINTLKKKAAK